MRAFQHTTFDPARLSGKRILDIGCGRHKLPGSVGLDHMPFSGVDVQCDLNGGLPFGDGAFEVVHANQVLEHIPNIIGLVNEVHRVLVPGGVLVAHVPYFRSGWAAIDPTHVRQFTLNSLDYFVRGTLCFDGYRFSEVSFSRVERFLDGTDPPSPFRMVFTALAEMADALREFRAVVHLSLSAPDAGAHEVTDGRIFTKSLFAQV